MKPHIFMIALLGCGGASTPAATTTGGDGDGPKATGQFAAEPEIALDEERIELNMARSIARQQALEQARATGVKKEGEPEPVAEPPPGPRTKETIRAAFVEARMNAIKRCYEAALYADQAAQGTATITFQIADNGTVTAPSATGMSDEMHACLVAEVMNTRFPTGGVTPVRWSLTFSSN